MSVSINDMRDFVSGGLDDIPGSDDFGNVINLGEIGDDLGANLLANTRVTPAPPALSKSVSFDIGGSNSGSSGIDILEPLESINLDINLDSNLGGGGGGGSGSSGPSIQINREDNFGIPTSTPAPPSWSFGNNSTTEVQSNSAEAEKKEKADLINKLNRLESKGYPVSKRFTMDNTLDEIKTEFDRLVDARQLETSVKFQRQMMMGLVTGVELLNEKFDPFDLQLKGWSESVHENIDDFDDVFEELYDKYKGKGSMPPEARLLMMLAGSGFMFHMSNSFFRSKMPSMDDIFRQNPGLQRQFAAAAANAAGPGFGNFMGAAMGMGGGQGPQMPPGPEFYQAPPNPPVAPTGMFYGSSRPEGQMPPQVPQSYASQEPPKAPRREMKGPSGVDDILKTFEEARRAESEPMFNPFGAGISPNGSVNMPTPTGTADIQQPAISAVSEIQSQVSEDFGSMAESRRGGGRRRKAQPIGSTASLDI